MEVVPDFSQSWNAFQSNFKHLSYCTMIRGGMLACKINMPRYSNILYSG